jgi:uncharacterized surface protein with fasciclin (FAS1) repeats
VFLYNVCWFYCCCLWCTAVRAFDLSAVDVVDDEELRRIKDDEAEFWQRFLNQFSRDDDRRGFGFSLGFSLGPTAPGPPTPVPTRRPIVLPVPTSPRPTRSPTKRPTTLPPSPRPTTAFPTRGPAIMPAPRPTRQPTLPTRRPITPPTIPRPTPKPTAVPTTGPQTCPEVCFTISQNGQLIDAVSVIETAEPIKDFYDREYDSFNGEEVVPQRSQVSQIMIHGHGGGGGTLACELSLLILHDRTNDGSGGRVEMDISGNLSNIIVQDDQPTGGDGGDSYVYNSETETTRLTWNWNECCTDGAAHILGNFPSNGCIIVRANFAQGIERWVFVRGPASADRPATEASLIDLDPTVSLEICRVTESCPRRPTIAPQSTIAPVTPAPVIIPSTPSPVPPVTPSTSAPVARPTAAPIASVPLTAAPVTPSTPVPAMPSTLVPIVPPARPTAAPVAPPTRAPIRPPAVAPVVPPTRAPARPPTAAPVVPPTRAPVRPPTVAPVVRPPTVAPVVRPPTAAPVVRPPTAAPVAPPTRAPVRPLTTAPVAPPTRAPVRPPTAAPVAPPTRAPVRPPTTAPVTPPTQAPAPMTLLFLIQNTAEFSILKAAIEAADKGRNSPPFLSTLLDDPNASLTVFAPINGAFMDLEAIAPGYLDQLLLPAFSMHLFNILAYHVTNGLITSDTFPVTDLEMLSSGTIDISADGIIQSTSPDPSQILDPPDFEASNGVAQVISDVLLPEFITRNVLTTLQASPETFSSLLRLIEAAGLQETIAGLNGVTFLAPTNAAILPQTEAFLLMDGNEDILLAVLSYHVVNSVVNSVIQSVPNILLVETLQGENVIVGLIFGPDQEVIVSFNQATRLGERLTQQNIIYDVGTILIPPSMSSVVPRSLDQEFDPEAEVVESSIPTGALLNEQSTSPPMSIEELTHVVNYEYSSWKDWPIKSSEVEASSSTKLADQIRLRLSSWNEG